MKPPKKPIEVWFSETSGLPKWFAKACVEKAHADYLAEKAATDNPKGPEA